MNRREFNSLAKQHKLRGRLLDACQLHLLEDKTMLEAAALAGCTRSGVWRAVQRLQRKICPTCRRPKP